MSTSKTSWIAMLVVCMLSASVSVPLLGEAEEPAAQRDTETAWLCSSLAPAVPCPLPHDEIVVAEVNGWPIRGIDLRTHPLDAGRDARVDPSERREQLEQVIDRTLMVQEALRQGLDRDPEVQRIGAAWIQRVQALAVTGDREPTEEEQGERLSRESLAYREALVVKLIGEVDRSTWPEPSVGDADVAAYCRDHPERLGRSRMVGVQRLLLLRSDGESEEALRGRAGALAEEIGGDRLLFHELALTVSQCPAWEAARESARDLGVPPAQWYARHVEARDLGVVHGEGPMVLWFCDGRTLHPVHLSGDDVAAIVALDEHEVSGAVHGPQGSSIFAATRVYEPVSRTCEENRVAIEHQLIGRHQSQLWQERVIDPLLAPLRAEADVIVHEDALERIPPLPQPPPCFPHGVHPS